MNQEAKMKPTLPQENDILPKTVANPALLAVLCNRRSTKIADFNQNLGPEENELLDILSVAMRVPDHGKLHPWRFIILQGEARKKLGIQMADILKARNPNMDQSHYEQEANRFLRAHSIVFLISSPILNHPKVPVWEQELGTGGLGYNITLAANAFGYIATWLSEWPSYDDEINELMGLAKHERMAGIFYIGKTDIAPIERERKPINSLVNIWK
jgi:nitroreductase